VTSNLQTANRVIGQLNEQMDPAQISQTIAKMSQEMMKVLLVRFIESYSRSLSGWHRLRDD
jgi:hypothetical protein